MRWDNSFLSFVMGFAFATRFPVTIRITSRGLRSTPTITPLSSIKKFLRPFSSPYILYSAEDFPLRSFH